MAPRARDRDHRHERQVHDDDADRADAERGRRARARRRQHRRAAQRAGRRRRRPRRARRRGEQLSARDDHDVPAVDCRAGSISPTTISIGTRRRRNTRRPRPAIFANQRPEDWAVVNADDPVGDARTARHRRHGASAFSPSGRPATASSVDGDWIVRRTATSASSALVPVSAVRADRPPHAGQRAWPPSRRRAIAGRRPAAMDAGAARLPRARARDGAGGRRSAACGSSTTRRRPTSRRPAGRSRASPGVSWRSSAAGSRAATCGELREALAARGRAVVAIGEAAPLVREALGRASCR